MNWLNGKKTYLVGLMTAGLGLAMTLWLDRAEEGTHLLALGLGLMGLRHGVQAAARDTGVKVSEIERLARQIEQEVRNAKP